VFFTCFLLHFEWAWTYVVLFSLVVGVLPSNLER